MYDQQFINRTNRWEQAYSKEGLERLERLYGVDLQAYDYSLPRRRGSKVRPLDAVDADALVNPLQQLRDRHQQIAGLQNQLLDVQQQLAAAQQMAAFPPLPSIDPPQRQWPRHNDLRLDSPIFMRPSARDVPKRFWTRRCQYKDMTMPARGPISLALLIRIWESTSCHCVRMSRPKLQDF